MVIKRLFCRKWLKGEVTSTAESDSEIVTTENEPQPASTLPTLLIAASTTPHSILVTTPHDVTVPGITCGNPCINPEMTTNPIQSVTAATDSLHTQATPDIHKTPTSTITGGVTCEIPEKPPEKLISSPKIAQKWAFSLHKPSNTPTLLSATSSASTKSHSSSTVLTAMSQLPEPSENEKITRFDSTSENSSNIFVFSWKTTSTTSLNSTALAITTAALETRLTIANFAQNHPKTEKSLIYPNYPHNPCSQHHRIHRRQNASIWESTGTGGSGAQ